MAIRLCKSALDRLANKIVEAERKTGHVRLAAQLEAILKQPKPKRVKREKLAARALADMTRWRDTHLAPAEASAR